MNTTTLIIVGIVFLSLIITSLIGTIIYMMFFRKVQVIVFGTNGMPNEIKKAKKKKNKLFFDKGANLDIVRNYVKSGKKAIYFADKLDERTYKPRSIVGETLSVNYNILNGIADSYEEGAIRFKFGLEKFAPFITIAVVTMICVLGTVMTMKYATSITPVEAEAMKDLGQSLKICTQYVSTSQETNLALAETLSPQSKGGDIPK